MSVSNWYHVESLLVKQDTHFVSALSQLTWFYPHLAVSSWKLLKFNYSYCFLYAEILYTEDFEISRDFAIFWHSCKDFGPFASLQLQYFACGRTWPLLIRNRLTRDSNGICISFPSTEHFYCFVMSLLLTLAVFKATIWFRFAFDAMFVYKLIIHKINNRHTNKTHIQIFM